VLKHVSDKLPPLLTAATKVFIRNLPIYSASLFKIQSPKLCFALNQLLLNFRPPPIPSLIRAMFPN
jgi:hypothetical protein